MCVYEIGGKPNIHLFVVFYSSSSNIQIRFAISASVKKKRRVNEQDENIAYMPYRAYI